MSLVGNFLFGSYDRTSEQAGASTPGLARRPSQMLKDYESDHGSNSSRRPSLTPSFGRTRSKSVSTAVHSSPAIPQTATIPEIHSDLPSPQDQRDLAKEGLEDAESPPAKFESSDDEYYMDENQTIADLALSLSRRATFNDVPSNPFEGEKDSALDPRSPNFRAREWTKSMIKLNREDGRTPMRTGGFAFRGLGAHGYGNATDYQKDVGNIWLSTIGLAKKAVGLGKPRRIDILHEFEGLVESGEMLVVLGPPGSGCSTFLKALTGETHGFTVNDESYINYQGIPAKKMHKYFRGEAIYTAEVDVHFPMMTVGDTLDFAARARAPRMIPNGYSKKEWSTHLRDVIMATFGISHTVNTRVGNDYVRGVSGGERKRVTIAEAALSGAVIQAWDNSTRGLDSANAIEFCKSVRLSTELAGCAAMVAIYQAPQAAYD